MEKEDNFISLLSDTTFKYLFKNEAYRPFFERLIKLTTNIDIKEYELYDNEINSGSKGKDYRLDILLKKDRDFIIIEMNSSVDARTILKNRQYLYSIAGGGLTKGEEFKKMHTILININNASYKENKNAITVGYDLINEEYKDVIDDIKIYDIYLESLKNIHYNGSNEKETYLALFRAKSFEEMREISGKNKEALRIVEELKRLSEDDEFRTYYDAEKVQRKLVNSARLDGYDAGYDNGIIKGKEEGAKEEKIVIAKTMLHKGMDVSLIREITGLDIEEIKTLDN